MKDGSNRDDTFMMEEQNAELQAAVMDLTAEDKDGEWGWRAQPLARELCMRPANGFCSGVYHEIRGYFNGSA